MFRLIGSPKRWDRSAALMSTLHWFETELLTREKHLPGLMASNRALLAQTEFQDHPDRVVLDMDSSESLVHGQQERGRAFLGLDRDTCELVLVRLHDLNFLGEPPAVDTISPPRQTSDISASRSRVEAALAETRGRVAGPSGAAAKLGVPLSTLDRRIKALNIDKRRFRFR
jgi:transcriptional regulator with GAF, ATPase, and Fis domain